MHAPVFLLSDFGLSDAFVGAMRAVVAGLAPGAQVHDLTHAVPPQDVAAGRLELAYVLDLLPDGAVTCAVVDPGVGGPRRAVAVRAATRTGGVLWAVAPDNGLLSPLLAPARRPYGADARAEAAWWLGRDAVPPHGPGSTFDGRDLFAPAAARLARGDAPGTLGRPADPADLILLPVPPLVEDAGATIGRVVRIDRFGNLVTDLPVPGAARRWTLACAGRRIDGPARGFADVPVGAPVAYLGSRGTVELALRDGDAATAWNVRAGDEARLEVD